MKIGVIADDFTGASDIALTLAEGGLTTVQYIGTPNKAPTADVQAGVIALKSRTIAPRFAVEQSLKACDWLTAQGAEQIIFKVCSTFDSTDQGNIGPVLDALANKLGTERTIVCPAFPKNGRSVYMGHLFVKDTLLNQSGMQHHPLTPMTDADLRRVLSAQTKQEIAHLPFSIVDEGPKAIRAALPAKGYIIADAINEAHLNHIGHAAAQEKLLCGGSGIALGLPANFGATAKIPSWKPIKGRGVVLSGSCSQATRDQVKNFKQGAPHQEIKAEDILTGTTNVQATAAWVMQQSSPPLIYSSANPEEVARVQNKLGQEKAATTIETFFTSLASVLCEAGIQKVVTAGGETSGAVVRGLHAQALIIGPAITPGVPLLRLEAATPMGLALKSGNFGGPDFFTEALQMMEKSA